MQLYGPLLDRLSWILNGPPYTSYWNFNNSFRFFFFFFLRKLIKCFCKAKLQNIGERERERERWVCLEEIAGVERHNTGREDWMICCWKNWLMGLLIRSSPMANTPALFAPTLPSSILLSCSLYVPFFQFSALLIFIVLFLCVLSWVIFKVIRT